MFDKDEITLSQAKKIDQEWPLWKEAIRTEFESMIIKNEAFETVHYKDIPVEMGNKIYPLLILLKREINFKKSPNTSADQ